jgi:hypothetical protein
VVWVWRPQINGRAARDARHRATWSGTVLPCGRACPPVATGSSLGVASPDRVSRSASGSPNPAQSHVVELEQHVRIAHDSPLKVHLHAAGPRSWPQRAERQSTPVHAFDYVPDSAAGCCRARAAQPCPGLDVVELEQHARLTASPISCCARIHDNRRTATPLTFRALSPPTPPGEVGAARSCRRSSLSGRSPAHLTAGETAGRKQAAGRRQGPTTRATSAAALAPWTPCRGIAAG